jgi:hypothetical protein
MDESAAKEAYRISRPSTRGANDKVTKNLGGGDVFIGTLRCISGYANF